MKNLKRLYRMTGLVITVGLLCDAAAHADEMDEATTITFSAPVQVPGRVLPAGTYLFKLADTDSESGFVQIFNSEGNILYATVETMATDRQEPTGATAIDLAEQGSGRPDALLKWFYPGRLTGSEFMYPGHQEQALEHDVQLTILATPNNHNSEAQSGD